MVADINPTFTFTPANPQLIAALPAGRVVFWGALDKAIGSEPYVSDGTATGTELLVDTCPGPCDGAIATRAFSYPVGSAVVFSDSRRALWVTDGTPLGTYLAINPQIGDTCSGLLGSTADGKQALFARTTSEAGCEPWALDLANRTWELLLDAYPGPGSSFPTALSQDYARGLPVSVTTAPLREELWVLGGRAADARRLAVANDTAERWFGPWAEAGSVWLFLGPRGRLGRPLWRTDGTDSGTRQVEVSNFDVSRVLGSVNGKAILRVSSKGAPDQLWASDGAADNTRAITNFAHRAPFGVGFGPPSASAPGRFYFVADDGAHGGEVWTTDGTPQGTRMVRDLCPGTCSSYPSFVTSLKGGVQFTASSPAQGYELWTTSAKRPGPQLVFNSCPGPCSSLSWIDAAFATRRRFFLHVDSGIDEPQVWVSDGTRPGTWLLPGALPPFQNPSSRPVSGFDADYFLGATSAGEGNTIYRTYGTPATTAALNVPSAVTALGSAPAMLASVGPKAYFLAHDGVRGYEPWVSDGTATGTHLVGEAFFGHAGIYAERPISAQPLGGGIAFRAGGTVIVARGSEGPTTPVRSNCSVEEHLVRDATLFLRCSHTLYATDGISGPLVVVSNLASTILGLVPWGQRQTAFITDSDAPLTLSDGTVAGTVSLPLPSGWGSYDVRALVSSNYLYLVRPGFEASLALSDGHTVWELGLPPGIRELKAFPHSRGLGILADNGEYWSTDGTTTGWVKHGTWAPPSTYGVQPPSEILTLANGILFRSFGGQFSFFDATSKTGKPLDAHGSLQTSSEVRLEGGRAYFIVTTPTGRRLVRTSTTGATAEILIDDPTITSFLPMPGGKKIFYSASTPETGQELWLWEE